MANPGLTTVLKSVTSVAGTTGGRIQLTLPFTARKNPVTAMVMRMSELMSPAHLWMVRNDRNMTSDTSFALR
jgi:hypothetical protein